MSAIHPNASIVSLSRKKQKLIRVDQTLLDIHQHFANVTKLLTWFGHTAYIYFMPSHSTYNLLQNSTRLFT